MWTRQPWRMDPANFTPPTRTPWGGRVILERIKADLELDADKAAYPVVGESWEISVEPSFPSRVTNLPDTPLLPELIARAPQEILGSQIARRFGGYPLLVKLLDSAAPLSVQVHPSDDHPALEPGQSGKPETWFIYDRAPGAGIYLGLKTGIQRETVEKTLLDQGDLSSLLNFVPVEPGDCFDIPPGTIHAIGPGVTLVEPQQVLPGRIGITYRYWDWNRRYDHEGRLSPTGDPRPLQIEQSLLATDFQAPRGPDFISLVRHHPILLEQNGLAKRHRLVHGNPFLLDTLTGSGALAMSFTTAQALVILGGRLIVQHESKEWSFESGESVFIPASLASLRLVLEQALVILTSP